MRLHREAHRLLANKTAPGGIALFVILTVSTVKDAVPNLRRFVSRNLANGVDHMVVFLDSVDPMNMIVGQMRAVLYYQQIFRPLHIVWMVVACMLLFAACLTVFRRFSRTLPQDI